MASSSTPLIHVGIGCTHSGSLWVSSGLDLINSGLRQTTIYHALIGFAKYAIYRSQRQRCTSSLGAAYTMRSEDATIAYIGTQEAHSLLSFDTRTRGA
jgi:hypothetical protein